MKKTTALTEEQIHHLRTALRGHDLEALITLALLTGMRRDELLSLKWQDLDLEGHELHFQNAKTRNRESLHIPEDIAAMLKQHRLSQMEVQANAGLTWANLDLVFPDSHGEAFGPRQLMEGWRSVLEQAGLPRISFHNVRATVKQQALHLENQGKGE